MAGNRFAITLVGNLTPFYNFIMFLAYFLRILFEKQVGWFFSKQHGSVLCGNLKNHENTVLGYKKGLKFVVNVIFEKFRR